MDIYSIRGTYYDSRFKQKLREGTRKETDGTVTEGRGWRFRSVGGRWEIGRVV